MLEPSQQIHPRIIRVFQPLLRSQVKHGHDPGWEELVTWQSPLLSECKRVENTVRDHELEHAALVVPVHDIHAL